MERRAPTERPLTSPSLTTWLYGGWVPRDGWAEDLRDPPGLLALYDHFVPTQSADPGVRTTLNVRDSTATVVFSPPIATSPGVTQTLQMANVLKRPIIVIDPSSA